jgi:tetratricopeptide (TPR) repeat protein
MQHFTKTLRSLVAAHRPKLVLAVLADFFEASSPDLHRQTLMIQANLAQTEREIATGVLDRAEARQLFARVNAGLLQLIEAVPGCAADETAAIARAQEIERTFQAEEPARVGKSGPNPLVLGLVAVVLALAAVVWWALRPAQKTALNETANLHPKEQSAPKSPGERKAENEAWRARAKTFGEQGQWNKALEAINNAFGLDFDDAELFNQRADIYLHLGRYSEARDDASRTITRNPNFCWGYLSLAQAYAKLNDEESFYHNLEQALIKHCEAWLFTEQVGFLEYRDRARFKRLMAKYRHK